MLTPRWWHVRQPPVPPRRLVTLSRVCKTTRERMHGPRPERWVASAHDDPHLRRRLRCAVRLRAADDRPRLGQHPPLRAGPALAPDLPDPDAGRRPDLARPRRLRHRTDPVGHAVRRYPR